MITKHRSVCKNKIQVSTNIYTNTTLSNLWNNLPLKLSELQGICWSRPHPVLPLKLSELQRICWSEHPKFLKLSANSAVVKLSLRIAILDFFLQRNRAILSFFGLNVNLDLRFFELMNLFILLLNWFYLFGIKTSQHFKNATELTAFFHRLKDMFKHSITYCFDRWCKL